MKGPFEGYPNAVLEWDIDHQYMTGYYISGGDYEDSFWRNIFFPTIGEAQKFSEKNGRAPVYRIISEYKFVGTYQWKYTI